jgi:cytochrome P450
VGDGRRHGTGVAGPDPDLGLAPLVGDDLHRALAGLRDRGPVVPVTFLGAPTHLVNGEHDIRGVLGDAEAFPGGATYAMSIEPAVGRTFISMDGAEHDRCRRLATPAFRSRAVTRFVDHQLLPVAHELVDRFAGSGEADLVGAFASLLPYRVIGRKLGLPVGNEARQRGWGEALLAHPMAPGPAKVAAAELAALLGPVIAQRRTSPGDDVLSALLRARDEGALDDDEVVSHVRLLYAVGATTTADALSNMFALVLRHADWLERAVADRAVRPAVVEEALRLEPPVPLLPRLLPHGGVIGGVELGPGSLVVLNLAGANRDPSLHRDPDVFDPSREPGPTLTFGFGSKFCPGNQLARQQMQAALDVVLDRLRGLELVAAEAPQGAILRSSPSVRVRWGR